MPTIVLLDVSLSMSRFPSSGNESLSLIDIATSCLSGFFTELKTRCKLEHSAFVVFSSLYEVLVKFTRDYNVLKKACSSVKTYDKTMLEVGLQGIETLVTEEWGKYIPINLLLVTDGSMGIGEGSLLESLSTVQDRNSDSRFPLPFSFPCNFNIICLANQNEINKVKLYYERLISMNYDKGKLIIPESLSKSSVQNAFTRLLNTHYNKYEGTLKCGHFESLITLSPSPSFQNSFTQIINTYKHPEDEAPIKKLELTGDLNVIGFLDIQCFANPTYVSRHLVIPMQSDKNTSGTAKVKDSPCFQPCFCVLLHGSLKMEKMAGVVKLGENWYGMLHSWAENKKKSNLMLSIFEPDENAVPWLGSLKKLGPGYELPLNPYLPDSKEGSAEESPFPVATSTRKSYHAQTNAAWIKESGLQSDIQKLLRYAKKLPEKQSAFFKEVNKIRRAGVAYGFHELLISLATSLENEAENMKAEVKVQLHHVAEGFRNAPHREMSKNIVAINMFRKKSAES